MRWLNDLERFILLRDGKIRGVFRMTTGGTLVNTAFWAYRLDLVELPLPKHSTLNIYVVCALDLNGEPMLSVQSPSMRSDQVEFFKVRQLWDMATCDSLAFMKAASWLEVHPAILLARVLEAALLESIRDR